MIGPILDYKEKENIFSDRHNNKSYLRDSVTKIDAGHLGVVGERQLKFVEIARNSFRGLSSNTRRHYQYFVEFYFDLRQKNRNKIEIKARYTISSKLTTTLSLGYLWCDATHGRTDGLTN